MARLAGGMPEPVVRWAVAAGCVLALTLVPPAAGVGNAAAPPEKIPALGSYLGALKTLDTTRSVCEFTIIGGSSVRPVHGAVSALAVSDSPLQTANITCRGPTVRLVGGPLLEDFAPNFEGVQYVQEVELPGATLQLEDASVSIENSFFSGLSFFGRAAVVLLGSNVTFLNATFVSNNNSAAGAIYAADDSALEVLDSVFERNSGGQGGAITVWNSSLIVNGTFFQKNTGRSAGGAISANRASSLDVTTSVFNANRADNGGAVFIDTCNTALFWGNTFAANVAAKSGAGLFTVHCDGNLFDHNVASKGSAGLEMNQCPADIVSNTFENGVASKGGGVYLQGVQGDITNCTFRNNSAQQGGAIFRASTTGAVQRCSFAGNTAVREGGAIYDAHVQGDVHDNRFDGNAAGNADEPAKGQAVYRTESIGDVAGSVGIDEGNPAVIAIDAVPNT